MSSVFPEKGPFDRSVRGFAREVESHVTASTSGGNCHATARNTARDPLDAKGRVHVGDRENNRIQVFDAEGNFLAQWKESGAPYGLFLSGNRLFVADGRAQWIMVLDLHGKLVGRFGMSHGPTDGPHMLCVDRHGAVYVTEVGNRRVLKYVPES